MTRHHTLLVLLFILSTSCSVFPGTIPFSTATKLPLFSNLDNSAPLPSVPRPEHRRYKTILSLDGGGLRLLFTNQILKRIEEEIKLYYLAHPEEFSTEQQYKSKDDFIVYLADYFNCIAGVSGASWTAVYLASKGGNGKANDVLKSRSIIRKYGVIEAGTAAGMDVFFMEYGADIYPPGIFKVIRGLSLRRRFRMPLNVPGMNSPLYPVRGLERALDNFVGDVLFSQFHTSCLVNAYDLKTSGPFMFASDRISAQPGVGVTCLRSKNDPRRHFLRQQVGRVHEGTWTTKDFAVGDLIIHQGMEFTAKDAALASSALPMFHPAHKAKPTSGSLDEFVFIDGGLVEGNPTLYSLNFVTSRQPPVKIDDIAIMSLGAGGVAGEHSLDANGGVIGWALSGALLNIAIGGASEAKQAEVDYLLYTTFGMRPGQYLRINHFAQGRPSSDEVTAFGSFDATQYLNLYKTVGVTTGILYSSLIHDFIHEFLLGRNETTLSELRNSPVHT
eukprot:g3255.t1